MLSLSLKRATESEEEMVANVPVSQKSHKAGLGIRQVSLVLVQTPKLCASILQTEVCAGPLGWLRHQRRSSREVTGASGAHVLSGPPGTLGYVGSVFQLDCRSLLHLAGLRTPVLQWGKT